MKNFLVLNKKDYMVLGLVFLVGFLLRLYPGKDQFIWTYDQARDAYVARSMIENHDIKIVGPQTEFVGLNHGPLYYYLIAPFYFISQGDPNLPALAMTMINLSTLVPIFLLTQAIFKNKKITFFSTLLFILAYQQIEYARWISNVSITIPLLGWTYYFWWRSVSKKVILRKKEIVQWLPNMILTGLFLGLSIQGEIFLLYLIPVFMIWLYFIKSSWRSFNTSTLNFILGLFIGLFPLIFAQVKFNFLGIKTFTVAFLGSHSFLSSGASEAVSMYLNHLGMVFQQNIFGLTPAMGLGVLGGVLILIWKLSKQKSFKQKFDARGLKFLLILFFSHSLLFVFQAIDAVFLDLSIYIPLLIIIAWVLNQIWQKDKFLFGVVCALIVLSQLRLLFSMTEAKTPYNNYYFIQSGITFTQKMEIVENIYRLIGDNNQFSLSVLGTPYGVQTVWASVFEQHIARLGVQKPVWYGMQALGYPADNFFKKVDAPANQHILIIESNQNLISPHIRQQVMIKQDSETKLIKEIFLYDYKIQLRQPVVE